MFKRLFSDPSNLMNIDEGVLKGLSITPPRKVDKPTYEIVGPVERYDGRDVVFSRMLLKPDSPLYEEYYARHPERKAMDDDRYQRGVMSGKKRLDKDPINELIVESGFYGALLISRPDIISAEVMSATRAVGRFEMNRGNFDTIDIDTEKMSRKIKAFALHLGAAKIGIAQLNQNWVYTYSNFPSGEPVELNYKNIICMAFTQDPFMTNNQTGRGMNFEIGWKYSYAGYVSIIIANFIRHLGWSARPLTLTNAPYLVVPTFIDAGIGEYGRCGFVVTKEFGNNWRPGAIATDLPLVSDKPVDFGLQDFCEKCQICAERCPVQAIPKGDRVVVRGVRRWQVDAEKCYSYWNTTGYSCGICQTVCPWNHPNNLFHNSVREIATRFPSLRSTIIKAEKFFYKYKPGPAPRWMTNSI